MEAGLATASRPATAIAGDRLREGLMEKIDEGLKSLLEQGKDKGYLTSGQVNDSLPDNAVNPEKLDHRLVEFLGIDGVVRQVVVDLAVCQVAFVLALLEQGFQA